MQGRYINATGSFTVGTTPTALIVVDDAGLPFRPKNGITINCLQPGRISSEQMLRMYPTEEKRRAFTQDVPIGRFGEPNELADLAVFLASPRASYITGTVIPVDGGLARFAF